MKKSNHQINTTQKKYRTLLNIMAILLIMIVASCNFLADEDDDSLKETQTELEVQQTLVAEQGEEDVQGTIDAQQATIDAQVQVPTADMAGTQAAQETSMAAGQTTPQEPPPPGTTPQAPPPSGDFETQMQSAQIMLFEDIVNTPRLARYIKDTLDAMDLRYKDNGSAKGWLKNDLLGGAPNGQPWDLVIIAIETRGGVSGEYFEYLNDVLKKGTAVILEAWHLDQISSGKISPILADCGVQVYPYFPKAGSLTDLVIYPLQPEHPVLRQPNSGMSFTKVQATWLPTGDLGSHQALTGGGDAILLLGSNGSEEYRDATLGVCMDGQLTLQTHSSHSYSYNTIHPLWENMIYNALKKKMTGSY